MSLFLADILIYILLLGGIGFGGIALMGLLIFPDIRSRMFTALRACLLCTAAIAGAAIVYALSLIVSKGGIQYFSLVVRVIILCGIIAVAIVTINRMLGARTKHRVYCGQNQNIPDVPENSG